MIGTTTVEIQTKTQLHDLNMKRLTRCPVQTYLK